MNKKSILKSLLACSILSSSNVHAAAIVIGAGLTEGINPGDAVIDGGGNVSQDYDFDGNNGVLYINADITYTGNLINGLAGELFIGSGHTLTYAGNTNLDVGIIDARSAKAFIVNNPNGTTTITSYFDHNGTGCKQYTFLTPTIVTHPWSIYTFGRFYSMYVGSKTTPTSFTIKPTADMLNNSNPIYLSHEDSELILDSSGSAVSPTNFRFGHYGIMKEDADGDGNPDFIVPEPQDKGIVTINAVTNAAIINDNGDFGTNAASRIKKLRFQGDSDITIQRDVFTKSIDFNSSGDISFAKDTNMGTDTEVNILQDANLFMTGGKTLKADDTTLDFGSSIFNLNEGNLNLTGAGVMNIDFDEDNNKWGKFVIGAGADTAKLDLSGLTGLTINLNTIIENGDVDLEGETEFSLKIFDKGANGTFTNIASNGLATPDNDLITLNVVDGNLFVDWVYDPTTHTITSKTDFDGLLKAIAPPPAPDPAPAPVQVSQNVVNIVTAITETAKEGVNLKKIKADELVTPTAEQKTAAKFIQFAGTLGSVEEVVEAVKNMDPETSSEALDDNSIGFETGRIVLDRNIDSISSNRGPEVAAAADSNPLGYGIAAGDDLSKKYGIWATPFYHKAIQRKLDGNAGYKVENFGTVIGVDTKISDRTTIGFAWGNVRSLVRMTGAKEGSKGYTVGNIFSLYSSLELPKNSFITGILSYGMSKIKRLEKKHLARNIYNYARSHYKSKMYSAEVIAGKNMYLGSQYTLTPMAGVKYSKYFDDAYKEHGTLFQNYKLTKKKYSHLDGSVGARLSYTTSYKGFKVIPNITGMAYFNLKDNPSTSYVTSDTFTKPLQLKGDKKSSKAWYSITAGLDFSKDNMEYSVEYENQIDKKYVGHQAKIKAKLNF